MPSTPSPCSFSVPPPPEPTGPALNAIAAIPPDQECRARHLRQCERLAELGMELVEAVQQEALDDIRPRPERRILPYSGQPAPLEGRDTTLADLFAGLSRCVRQAILLEARLRAGAYDRPNIATPDFATPDFATPDIATPDRARHPAAPASPASAIPSPAASIAADHPRLRLERIEDDLAADATGAAPDIIAGICAQLGAAIDSGLAPARPIPPAPADREAPRIRPPNRRRPIDPPPLSQAECARQLYLQQGTPPPPRAAPTG